MDLDNSNSNINSELTSPAQNSPAQTSPVVSADHGTAKHRPPGSCDFCRRLKIKCEKQSDGRCSQCIARDAQCVRTVLPKRARAKRVGKEQLSTIEGRIRQMESVLASAISRSERSDEIDSCGEGNIERQMSLSDSLSLLVLNDTGGSTFVGPSSGFSLFSPRGLSWISDKTGNKNLAQLITQVSQLDPGSWDQGSWTEFVNAAWRPLPVDQREPMPRKEVATGYVDAFFLFFNLVFPLFNRRLFDAKFERQYSADPPKNLAWYACFNVVMALGNRIVGEQYIRNIPQMTPEPPSEELSIRYLRNATSVFIDLQFGTASLMSVQAMIAMAILLQGSTNPLPAYTLVSTAVRIAHAIGLHHSLNNFGLSEDQTDERRNVFWILYIIEKGFSIQSGRPSVIHDQDIGISLPTENPTISTFPSGNREFNTFVILAKLARIESRVYSDLYSARSRTRSVLQRLKSIGILDTELQKWRNAVPIEIRPEHDIVCDEQQIIPVIVMHYSYYHCLTTIHRASIHYGPWTSDSTDLKLVRPEVNLNSRVYASEAICVAAARKVIEVLEHFNSDHPPPMIWIAVSQPLCASLTLFAHILQHPEDPSATSDLNQIHLVTSLLGQCVALRRLYFATGTLWIFYELHRIAELFLSKHKESRRTAQSSHPTNNKSPQSNSNGVHSTSITTANSTQRTSSPPSSISRSQAHNSSFQPNYSLHCDIQNMAPPLHSQNITPAAPLDVRNGLYHPTIEQQTKFLSQHFNAHNDVFSVFPLHDMDSNGIMLDEGDGWLSQLMDVGFAYR